VAGKPRDESIVYFVCRARSQAATARLWLLTEKLGQAILDRTFYNQIVVGCIRDVDRFSVLQGKQTYEQL
jgi:hypothetical protein